jgi:hypothetical protein
LLDIVSDGGISLFGSGKFIMEIHRPGSCGGGEVLAESILELLSCAATENLRKEIVGDCGQEHAEDELILSEPLECLWVSGEGERPICGGGSMGVGWGGVFVMPQILLDTI